MPRLTDANRQPLHTSFMQHALNTDSFTSSGNGSEQIGQSSSSDLLRPFFISTSCFPVATHSSHRRKLCLIPRCSSLYEPSGNSRSHAPQIFMMRWGQGLILHLQLSVSFVVYGDDEGDELRYFPVVGFIGLSWLMYSLGSLRLLLSHCGSPRRGRRDCSKATPDVVQRSPAFPGNDL